jgi:hypothetical protein
MSKGKNKYEKKAKQKSMLEGITSDLETKGDLKNTLIETGKDLLVGGLGGSLVGAVIGRLSLAIGAVVTGIGHYTKSRLTAMFGVGMMAGGAITPPTLSGKDDGDLMDGIKERAIAFKDNLTHRLFLDNAFTSGQTAPEADTSNDQPVGEIKYFLYPGSEETKSASELQGPDIDLTALDHLHQQVADSGEKYKLAQQARQQEVSGELPESEIGNLDSEDRIY